MQSQKFCVHFRIFQSTKANVINMRAVHRNDFLTEVQLKPELKRDRTMERGERRIAAKERSIESRAY